MKILVLNCGSSSLKYQLIDMETENVLAKGLCERIGIEGSRLKHQPAGKEAVIFDDYQENHSVSVKMVLDALTNPEYGVVKSMKEINAVGHRVVHGGEYFANSVIITPEVIEAIEKCCQKHCHLPVYIEFLAKLINPIRKKRTCDRHRKCIGSQRGQSAVCQQDCLK